jgi:hypothetical protein
MEFRADSESYGTFVHTLCDVAFAALDNIIVQMRVAEGGE